MEKQISKKAGKRLQKKLAKQAKKSKKNIRFQEGIKHEDKLLTSKIIPDLNYFGQIPEIEDYKKHAFTWTEIYKDNVGSWSWGETREWTDDEYDNAIAGHLNNLLNNSWDEVEEQTYNAKKNRRWAKNKYQYLDTLCEEAIERWLSEETNEILNQFTELFRLRTGSSKRIWGIRCCAHFFLVWYEKEHKICPIDKH